MSRALVLALIALWVSPTHAAPPTWQWEHPTPHGSTITALHGVGTTLHAVGARGAILVSRDTGTTWRAVASGTIDDLQAVAGSGTLVIAVGERGMVLRSRDGETFERRPVATTASLVDVDVDGSLVLAVGADGSVLRSRDGGERFDVLSDVAASTRFATSLAIAPSGILVGGEAGLWRSTDQGTTFARVATESIQRIAIAPDGTIYAIAGIHVRYRSLQSCGSCIDASYETVAMYRSTDGTSWQRRTVEDPTSTVRAWGPAKPSAPPQKPPPTSKIGWSAVGPPLVSSPWGARSIAIGPTGELFVGANQQLLVSSDRGATFATRAAREPQNGALWAGAKLLVAAGGGALATSADRGVSWHELTAARATAENLFAITTTPSGRVFAVGDAGAVFTRSAAGAWTTLATPTGSHQRLSAIFASDDEHLIVVGDRGVILVSSDGGKSFQHRATDRTADLTAVWGVAGEIFAAGRETVLHSRDHGKTWTTRSTTLYSTHALWGTAPDDLYALGAGLFHSVDRGKTWTELGKLDGWYTGMWGSGAELHVVGSDGRILHSRDRGKTWKPRTSGTTVDLRRIWGRGDDLYVVGGESYDRGIVLRSRDVGATWREELVPAQATMFDVTGTANAVFVIGSGASILRGAR